MIREFLDSPEWLIITTLVIYSIILILLSWKLGRWFFLLSKWSEKKTNEKKWNSRIEFLEKENTELIEQIKKLEVDSTDEGHQKKKSLTN